MEKTLKREIGYKPEKKTTGKPKAAPPVKLTEERKSIQKQLEQTDSLRQRLNAIDTLLQTNSNGQAEIEDAEKKQATLKLKPIPNMGRKPKAPEDKVVVANVWLTLKERSAIEEKHGSLTAAIKTTI